MNENNNNRDEDIQFDSFSEYGFALMDSRIPVLFVSVKLFCILFKGETEIELGILFYIFYPFMHVVLPWYCVS